MRMLSSIWAVASIFLRPSLRQPLYIVLITLIPISLVVVFHVVGGRPLGTHALYGIAVVFATNTGVVALPQLVVAYRANQLQEVFVATPIGPGIYALGMGVSRLLLAMPALAIVLAMVAVRGSFAAERLPLAVGILFAMCFIGVMIGFTIATLTRNLQEASVVANMTGSLLTVLPPVYYPLELLPATWRWVAMLAPTTHAAQLLRSAGGLCLLGPGMLAVHSGALLLWATACGLWVFRRMQWRER